MSRYHELSVAQKRAESLARIREPAVTCPDCDTQVMLADLLGHIEQRCPGLREPGPGSKWVSHREAMAMGVGRGILSYWVKRGRVRTRMGDDGCRQYLHGDLVRRIAVQRLNRRR